MIYANSVELRAPWPRSECLRVKSDHIPRGWHTATHDALCPRIWRTVSAVSAKAEYVIGLKAAHATLSGGVAVEWVVVQPIRIAANISTSGGSFVYCFISEFLTFNAGLRRASTQQLPIVNVS